MTYVVLILLCVIFFEMFLFLDLRREASSILDRSRAAIKVLSSADMEDDAKEVFMRRASLEMLKTTGKFVLKFSLLILVLYLVYWLAIVAFPELRSSLAQSIVSPIVIVLLTIVTLLYGWARNVFLKQL